MPRTIEEIISKAEELAARFEEHEPDSERLLGAAALRELRDAFLTRAHAEQRLTKAVEKARSEGHSWVSIGVMVGTSGEAARQRYGQKVP